MPCERKIWLIVLSLMTMLSSCSVTSLREAQYVVAQADSLWHESKIYGVDGGDCGSLTEQFINKNINLFGGVRYFLYLCSVN